MSSKDVKIMVIILGIVIIILSVIALFLFGTKGKKYDIELIFANNDDMVVDIDVNSAEFRLANVRASLDNTDLTNLIEVDNTLLDLNTVGTYKIIYYLVYEKKRYELIQTVNVVDKMVPVITLKGKNMTILLNHKYEEPGFEASDNYDGNLTDKVIIDNQLDNTKEGTYKITYTVLDSSGNKAEVVREVTVRKPNQKVAAPKEEKKAEPPKLVPTNYSNTIKSNKFTSSKIILEGYLKEPLEENKIKLVGETIKEYDISVNNNNYRIELDISDLANGTYKGYINEDRLLNKMAEIERLARAKVGSKLVTFSYTNDEVSINITDHSYQYDILINPGHGADDTGAINEYITEKEMNLKVSMYEKCRYEAHGLRVYMTRVNDTYSRDFGPRSAIRLHRLAYEMGYYGAVSKIVYSNHHNFIGNDYYMGYEILVAGALTSSELSSEIAIANKWNSIYTMTDNHLRFYARDYDTEVKYAKLGGQTYTFKDNYAVNRIPYRVSNVKSIIYEGCYMSNDNDFKWYWLDENWYRVSEAKIEVYVKSLGINYNSDNSSCL